MSELALRAQAPRRAIVARLRSLGPASWISIAFLSVVFVASLFADAIAPHDPRTTDVSNAFSPPTWQHLFGTDDLGRDTFTRMLHGARISMMAAALASGVALGIGIPVGLVAGYYGGRVDAVLMRMIDTIMTFPGIVFAIAITAALGPNVVNAMIAIGIVGSPMFARLLRAQALAIRGERYVDASRTFGSGGFVIMTQHVLPNSVMPVIVQTSVYLGVALLAEATMSFLGLGVQPPRPSWGGMLASSQTWMTTNPYQMIPPGLALTLTVLAFNTLGEELRTAMDPRALRGRLSEAT